ncbi:hypothetical protein [Azospirillum ramasamyi]|uniref:hypothetical protein n=1 Tax=Azospirillum ramasamyi TaxID=682998 RepID=UPI0013A6E2CD|nr:hypothetical protein [Azospirillum ramasamyi]
MLSELITRNDYDVSDTELLKTLTHNKDLCPMFRNRVNNMLEVYSKHRVDVYDIQGIKDDGVDVILTYKDEDGEKRVGLQIKSYNEIEEWYSGKKSEVSFLKNLKSQYADAFANARVQFLYIVICTDAARHIEQIRSIAAAFKTYADVKIIIPPQSMSLLYMSNIKMTAIMTKLLCQNDYLLKEARSAVSKHSQIYARLLIELTCRAFNGDSTIDDRGIFSLSGEGKSDEDITNDIITAKENLENDNVLIWNGNGYDINPTSVAPLCAIYFDQKVRHDLGDMMVDYLSELLYQ